MKSSAKMSQKSSSDEPEVGTTVIQSNKLSYMHRPPTIMPNYGAKYKGGVKLKTKMNRVLLYDNVTQQSILKAQISYIQSQCYKAGRQMETSLKAFLQQKQHKDRALNKLTKVHHADDYAKFELEYYGFHQKNAGKVLEDKCDQRVVFPCIHKQNVVGVIVKNLLDTTDKSRQFSMSNLMSEVVMDGSDKTSSYQFSNIDRCKEITSFPRLTNTLPVSFTANEHHQNRSVIHFVPIRNVKLRVKKGFPGNTGILQEKNGLTVNDMARERNVSVNNHPNREQIKAATTSNDNVYNFENALIKKVYNRTVKDSVVKSASISKSYKGTMKEPILDQRFEQLQQVLIRQDPPNDGFIELSPSFAKRSSFQFITDRSSYLNIEGPQPSEIVRIDRGDKR